MKKQSFDEKIKRCKLYLNQENQIDKFYMTKKRFFKNYIDDNINQFKVNYQNFKTFCLVSSSYSENIVKNIENIKKTISLFEPHEEDSQHNLILNDFERILVTQLDGEKEKIERFLIKR